LPNGRCFTRSTFFCENESVLLVVMKNFASQWPAFALYLAAAGVLVLGGLVGALINRRRGHRSIAQRLTALGARLGVEPRDDDGKVESALSFLEEVTVECRIDPASQVP
jgi:hypothetical protein